MRAINYRELKKLHDKLGGPKFARHLDEAMDPEQTPHGTLMAQDFSILELARVCFGDDRLRDVRAGTRLLTEAGDGVDYSTFTNITGRIVSNTVMQAYRKETSALSQLISTETNVRIDNERLPGFTGLGDAANPVHPGMPFDRVGYTEDYQDMPRGQKYGLIVPVTKEAIFFDRTGQILREAQKVGESLAYRKEREIAQLILGITANYSWAGTTYRTYLPGPVTAAAPWDNIHDAMLEDWTDIDEAERLFDQMTDPNTSQPIIIGEAGLTVLVMPAKYATASRILTATQVRHTMGVVNTVSANPLSGYVLGPKSRILRAEAVATNDFGNPNEIWWLGDFKKAFVYRENWPVQVMQAPTNSQDEWDRDIVAQFKGTERGVAAVLDPRYVVVSSSSCGHSSSGATECTEDAWPSYDSNGGSATR